MSVVNIKSALENTGGEREEICEKHGKFISKNVFSKVWSKCPVCTAETAKREAQEAEAAELREKSMRWSSRVSDAGIPVRFNNRTLENYVVEHDGHRRVLKFAQGYVDGFSSVVQSGVSFVLSGGVGSGKCHLACGIAIELMKRNRTVLFRTMDLIIMRLRSGMNHKSEKNQIDLIAEMVFPDLLIIDEVGLKLGATEDELRLLFLIINERYNARKPMLLITNLNARKSIEGIGGQTFINEIKQFLGDRIYDRLSEDGGKIIGFDWESYRKKAQLGGGG